MGGGCGDRRRRAFVSEPVNVAWMAWLRWRVGGGAAEGGEIRVGATLCQDVSQ